MMLGTRVNGNVEKHCLCSVSVSRNIHSQNLAEQQRDRFDQDVTVPGMYKSNSLAARLLDVTIVTNEIQSNLHIGCWVSADETKTKN